MPTAKSQPADEPEDASAPDPRDAQIEDLQRQLAAAKEQIEALRRPTLSEVSGQPVRLKVEPPHSELHYAGWVVGTEYTEVPANLAAAFAQAASDAGVTLTQDQEG